MRATQCDWVGGALASAPFKDIRNQREADAQEKARLCLELGALLKAIPPSISGGGSANRVRAWMATREACLKVCSNKRASAVELGYAIKRMHEAAKGPSV